MKLIYTFIDVYLILSLLRLFYTVSIGFFYSKPKSSALIQKENPFVSVIIPAWNEQVGIGKTIKSVLNSSYKNLEIIIINDGSKDNTKLIIDNYASRYTQKIRVINQKNGGKANALNNGIKHSKGEILITIDADSYVYPDAIEKLIAAYKDPYIDGAVGTVKIGNKNSLAGLIQYFDYSYGFHIKKTQSILDSIYILPGALSSVRRNVFFNVGGYENYSKTEDFDFSLKVRANGYKVVHIENAICVTEGASTFKSLLNQRVRWKHGAMLCLFHHRKLIFNLKNRSKYLSFIELPLAVLSFIDLFLYPLLILCFVYISVSTKNSYMFLIFYLILPIAFIYILDEEIKEDKSLLKYLPFIPIFFYILAGIEFLAVIKSLDRVLRKKQTQWSNWVRVGV